MGKCDDNLVCRALDEAERRGVCLVPANEVFAQKLRRRRERFGLMSPRRGLYVRQGYWDALPEDKRALCLLRSLAILHDKWVFCSVSAAVVYGFDVPFELLGTVYVHGGRGCKGRADNYVRTRASVSPDTFIRQGVRVVNIYEALFGCMCDAPFDCAVAIVDSALHKGVDREKIRLYLAKECRGRQGVRRARKILLFADGRAESGGESRARVAMARLGFAAPELQVSVSDPFDTSKTYRHDYFWMLSDGSLVAAELDGKQKYRDSEILQGRTTLKVLTDERRRESRLSLYRIPILRFSFEESQDPVRFSRLLEAFGIPRDASQTGRVE